MDKIAAKKYECSMHCEGDKVYQRQGNCPVCHMYLVLVDKNVTHTERRGIIMHSMPNNDVQ